MSDPSRHWASRLFGATDAPWGVSFALHILIGLLVGAGVLLPFFPTPAALLGGLCAGLIAGVSARVPAAVATWVALMAGAVAIVCAGLGVLASPTPVLAALAMGAIVLASSLAAAAGLLGAGLGLVGSFTFAFATSVRVLGGERAGGVSDLVGVVAAGAALGVLVGLVSALVRAKGRLAKLPRSDESLGRRMLRSLRMRDEHFRDGVRRAIPLAVAMLGFSAFGGRDAYWIFLAAFTILLPTGKPPVSVLITRIAGTIVGVVAVGLLALVIPTIALAAIAVVALIVGIAAQERYPTNGAALSSIGAIMFVGLPSGSVTEWAAHRLLDTLIGSALAVVALLVLWPRDRPKREAEAGIGVPG